MSAAPYQRSGRAMGLIALLSSSVMGLPGSMAQEKVRDLDEILREEQSILDALDQMVFEARKAERAVSLAEAAAVQAETRLKISSQELEVARALEVKARNRLRDTLRLLAAARPLDTATSILLGLGNQDDGRRRVLLDRLSARQATELSRLMETSRTANAAEFVASMERANSYAAAAAGREARSRLETETESRRKLLSALESDRALHSRHVREMGEARKAMVALIESRLSRAPGAVRFERMIENVRWPLADARVLIPFGNRIHPEFKTVTPHPGLTLEYHRGQTRNVRAVAFGRVVFAGDMRGFGTTVILDHASGYYTVYAGLPILGVQEEDIVREGDILGQVQREPGDDKLRLYFELRQGGEALNPLPYLKKRIP